MRSVPVATCACVTAAVRVMCSKVIRCKVVSRCRLGSSRRWAAPNPCIPGTLAGDRCHCGNERSSGSSGGSGWCRDAAISNAISPDPGPRFNFFHYTTNANKAKIEKSGAIVPGPSGLAWVSPTAYDTAAAAQSDLALPNTPDGYFIIPSQNVQTPLTWSPVMPD